MEGESSGVQQAQEQGGQEQGVGTQQKQGQQAPQEDQVSGGDGTGYAAQLKAKDAEIETLIEVLNLRIRLEENERLAVGDTIVIPMMDGFTLEREIMVLPPKYAGDYAAVSKKTAQKVASGEWGTSKEPVLAIDGPEPHCDAVVIHVPYHEVRVEENIRVREFVEERRRKACLTPFKELRLGSESIYDWVEEGYTVPTKVIAYLKITEPGIMSPGIYEHPSKPGERLLGPYCYTDGHYWWDRDTWKYVTRHHVRLPQEFVDYVMSGAGDEFAREHIPWARSWFQHIEDGYGDTSRINLLPDDAGDIEDF